MSFVLLTNDDSFPIMVVAVFGIFVRFFKSEYNIPALSRRISWYGRRWASVTGYTPLSGRCLLHSSSDEILKDRSWTNNFHPSSINLHKTHHLWCVIFQIVARSVRHRVNNIAKLVCTYWTREISAVILADIARGLLLIHYVIQRDIDPFKCTCKKFSILISDVFLCSFS